MNSLARLRTLTVTSERVSPSARRGRCCTLSRTRFRAPSTPSAPSISTRTPIILMMMILIFERERRREYVSLKGKKKWRINDRERARERKVLSTHQRGSSKPKQKSNQNHTHIRPIRDRGDRFPSFIDSFCPIRDCFRLGFECFLDRFCFLQHDDDTLLLKLILFSLLF